MLPVRNLDVNYLPSDQSAYLAVVQEINIEGHTNTLRQYEFC